MAIIDRQGRTVDEGDVPASDYAHSGLAIKAPCRVATTANITLSGEQTIDGVAVVADDRVLVRVQTAGSENGIYKASTGPWTRVTDMDGSGEIAHGTQVFVTDGSTFGVTLWHISTADPITIGTTSITFTQLLGIGDVNGPVTSVIGNIATFAHADGGEIQDSGVAVIDLAPKASPTFTGTPAAPTAADGTNTTQLATTAFVQGAISLIKNGVSSAFDTLSEIATELATKGTGTVTSVIGNGVTINTTGTIPPPYGLVNHSLAVSAAGSALTIALKDASGSDPSASSPVNGYFRNVTGTTGSWTQLLVTGALSLTVSSGSTLGVTSSTAFRLWVVLFNDGGTARLGVVNCSTSSSTASDIYPLQSGIPASSTAEGGAGAADSAGVIYTGTAVTSKAYLIVGYAEWSSSGLTAGTWTTTNLLYVQSFGPGIYKPGEVLRRRLVSTATETATTSSTYQTTNASAAITPTSAANLVRVSMGGLTRNGNSSLTTTIVSMFRDSTQIGSSQQLFSGSGAANIYMSDEWLDKPNSTSSITYAVKVASQDNTTSVSFARVGTTTAGTPAAWGRILVEEIQG